MSKELSYVQAATEILKHQGRVSIGYITAELEPYSAQQKPDISFVPQSGPNAEEVFFVELRLFDSGQVSNGYLKALSEHRAFAQEGAEHEYAGFALATNVELTPDDIDQLAGIGVHYLGPVDSGATLANRIIEWVSKPT